MVGKKSSKRSALYSKGTNATLDQFFIVKNKPTENSTSTTTTNENNTKTITLPSDISKQQQTKKLLSPLSPLPSKSLSDKSETRLANNKQHRRPLAEIGGKSDHALSMMPTTKPTTPSFTVLRDDDIEQGATEADIQQQTRTPTCQSPLSTLPPPDKTDTQQQTADKHNVAPQQKQQQPNALKDDDDDTQDSQASSFGEYNKGTPKSFFGDDSDDYSEFRVDALDTDTDDDNSDTNDNHGTSSSFFDDDDDEPLFLTKTHRRTHFPAVTTPSIPSKRSPENKDDDKETNNSNNKMVKRCHRKDDNLSLSSTTVKETDNQATNDDNLLEFPVSNSLTIPLNIKDNYHSSLEGDEDDDNDTDSPSPPSSAATRSGSDVASSSQQRSSESPTNQLQRSQSPRASDMPTLPMSFPSDEALDLHVAYPVPRGKQLIDKFGQ